MTHIPRKVAALCVAASVVIGGSTLRVRAAETVKKPDLAERPNQVRGDEITPQQQEAVRKGLAWLAAHQQPDGSYGAGGGSGKHAGITALAGLAFMQAGNLPGRGQYGDNVQKCLDFVLASCQESGLIASDQSHGPMYGHGFATLYLAEVYGMDAREEVRDVLARAVRLIIASQNDEGGWRYTPESPEADISVTVCQAMALRAARNAGIAVPKETIDRCIRYIENSQNPDGGFRYRLLEAAESKFPRSAAALVALYTSGVHEGPAIERGLDYLMEFIPGDAQSRNQEYYFYGQYYAVQAVWHADGDQWRLWYPRARDELIELQLREGRWSDPWIGDEYATAMALIVLQTPNGYLPIFER